MKQLQMEISYQVWIHQAWHRMCKTQRRSLYHTCFEQDEYKNSQLTSKDLRT